MKTPKRKTTVLKNSPDSNEEPIGKHVLSEAELEELAEFGRQYEKEVMAEREEIRRIAKEIRLEELRNERKNREKGLDKER